MLDTVVFRVHNLSKKLCFDKNDPKCLCCFDAKNKECYHDVFSQMVPVLVANSKKVKQKVKRYYDMRDYLAENTTLYFDEGKSHKNIEGYLSCPSSHYYIRFYGRPQRDHLEFNFSIPKYLYGHNVAQFVQEPNRMNSYYPFRLDEQYKYLFNNFLKFSDYFFNFYFPFVDKEDIEINRIDFCFNQFFRNKKDSLIFLDSIKKIKFSNSKGFEYVQGEWGTTLMKKNKYYSFKVYHKGEEFRKNDCQELKKINEDNEVNIFDLSLLQSESDRILRYEMTFRNSYFNYLYKTKVYKKNNSQYIFLRQCFNKVKNKAKVLTDVLKKADELSFVDFLQRDSGFFVKDLLQKKGLRELPLYIVNKYVDHFHDLYRMILCRQCEFYLKINDYDIEAINLDFPLDRNKDFYIHTRALFSEKLFDLLYQKFKLHVDLFQSTKRHHHEDYHKLLRDYNFKLKHNDKISVRNLENYFNLLNLGIYDKQILHDRFFSYEVLRKIKKFLYVMNNGSPYLKTIIHTKVDFTEYFNLVLTYPKQFFYKYF